MRRGDVVAGQSWGKQENVCQKTHTITEKEAETREQLVVYLE